jgi:restriction system protein
MGFRDAEITARSPHPLHYIVAHRKFFESPDPRTVQLGRNGRERVRCYLRYDAYETIVRSEMLTTRIPCDWRDLQATVARILTESGFSAQIEKVIETVRGRVEIDVYAQEAVDGRMYTVLCECKHWAARVPQSVIHGFRTVVADSGANLGYMISMAGFQSGALTAVELTNIRLVNWEEFQREFESSWIKNHLVLSLGQRWSAIFRRADPMSYDQFNLLDETGKRAFIKLWSNYDQFASALFMLFSPEMRMTTRREVPRLPLRELEYREEWANYWPNAKQSIPDAVLDAQAYGDFLEATLAHIEEAIGEFRQVITMHRST